MNTSTPSTELTHISTQLLLEQTIREKGTDRSKDERVLIDADWQVKQPGGDARVRLLQIGFGAQALYALRITQPHTEWTDCYHYSPTSHEATQSAIRSDTPHTKPLPLSVETATAILRPLLYSSFTDK